jgi:citrate lyase subunit beta/citryl-CoA lyase
MSRGWRSALFVAANDAARIAKIHTRGADAVILDLEDAVPAADKPAARAAVVATAEQLVALGQTVAVRINSNWLDAVADLEAAVLATVTALVVPKVECPHRLAVLIEMIGEWEAARALPAGGIGVIALIESPAALSRMTEIAAIPRVTGLALGTEDFSLALGVAPTPQSLDLPCRLLAFAAAERELMALALRISIGAFDDDAAYANAIANARAVGLTGALCIHPKQVTALNAGFAPNEQEIVEAEAIIAAWDARGSVNAIKLGDRMIDPPVAARARQLLRRLSK